MFKKKLLLGSFLALNLLASSVVFAADKIIEVVINENGYPFSFVDDKNNITGYDGDLLKVVGERLKGYKFNYNAVSRDAMIVGLSTGSYALATNHFYLTKERAKNYEYSKEPTGLSDLRLILRKNENDIRSLSDLAQKGKKLFPVHTNDARYTVIEDYNKKNPANKIVLTPSGESTAVDQFKSVASGEYDAAIYPVGAFLAVQKALNLDLKTSPSVGFFPTVFLYNKNVDKKLIQEIDRILVDLKKDGTLSKLSKKWYLDDVYTLKGANDVKVNTNWE
jgi:L-cystine transport system substrate-binding protein